jgi:hypothetical protein
MSIDGPRQLTPVITPKPIARWRQWFAPEPVNYDPVLVQWLIDLRNPQHQPAMTGWIDGLYGKDRCAVGWLLERSEGQWYSQDGHCHTAYKEMCHKYGKRFLRNIIRMHDAGVPWSSIANYIERTKSGHFGVVRLINS